MTQGKGGTDFTELSRMVTASGLTRRRYGYYWTKLIAVPIVIGALLVVFVWLGDTWWRRQVLMSRNIRGSRALDTVMGGLNYQIEHTSSPRCPARTCAQHPG